MRGERGRDADDDDVRFVESGKIRRGFKVAGADGFFDSRAVDVGDVAFAAVERLDFGGIHIKAQDAETFFGVGQRQRQADVSQADDADEGLAFIYFC